jgi:SAM-dependent MidA family methyltransferase
MRISRPEPSDEHRRTPGSAGSSAHSSRKPESHRPELLAALREAEGARGFIPFATYMDLALFHPAAGYYARLEAVGAAGDFATSPSLTPSFGKLFARQFHQIWRALGAPSTFDVIEAGPGAGQFAESVLTEAERFPRFGKALRYGLMERSASLRAVQAQRLSRWQGRTRWGESLAEIAPAGVTGVIVSNEFFDALPCHWLEATREGLREVAVRVRGDRLEEVLVPPTSMRLAQELEASGVVLKEGQRVEVSLAALDAMEALARGLARGAVITVDYGDVAREVHHARRMRGSLRGYFRHMAVADPYARPGEQDLTYDVDFTALARAGERGGLTTLGLLPQGEVLGHLGLAEEIRERRRGKSRLAADLASAALEQIAHPQGMGEGFKVLFQGKGLAREDLAGLGFAALPKRRWRFWG